MQTRSPLETPVLLIIFRRPDFVENAIAKLREVRPRRLYVAADGPRTGVAGEADAVAVCRAMVANGIDWECDLKLRFRDSNLGVQHGVVDAIDWLFDNEAEGIILEDDVDPTADFFYFCQELLAKYRNDRRVATISGTSYWKGRAQHSFHASNFIDMWGWATWRDRWKLYDAEMNCWPAFADSGRLAAISGATPRFVRYWREIMDRTKAGGMRAWDYQWILTCWDQQMFSIFPTVPLVINCGFDDNATNTPGWKLARYCRKPQPMAFPLKAPRELVPDPVREKAMWAFRFHISDRDAILRNLVVPVSKAVGKVMKLVRAR